MLWNSRHASLLWGMPRWIVFSATVILPGMTIVGAEQSTCSDCSCVVAQRSVCVIVVHSMKFTSWFLFLGHAQVDCFYRHCDPTRNENCGSKLSHLPWLFLCSSTAKLLLKCGACYEIHVMLPLCGACPGELFFSATVILPGMTIKGAEQSTCPDCSCVVAQRSVCVIVVHVVKFTAWFLFLGHA